MTNNRSNKPIKTDRGFFRNLGNEIRLVFKLMGDPRISIWLKALPFGSLVYFIFPDLLPANPVDDAVVIGVGIYLFIELCPPHIVQEHREALNETIPGEWKDVESEGDIIESDFRDE